MNTRFKHLSKSTISVLLSLLMIVSTVTVGIVATNAAYTEDEVVGYSTSDLHLKGSWDWDTPISPSSANSEKTEFTFNLPQLNASSSYSFLIYDDYGNYFKNGTIAAGAETNSGTTISKVQSGGSDCTLNTMAAGSGKVNVTFYFQPDYNNYNGIVYSTQSAVPTSDYYMHWGTTESQTGWTNNQILSSSTDYSFTAAAGTEYRFCINTNSSSIGSASDCESGVTISPTPSAGTSPWSSGFPAWNGSLYSGYPGCKFKVSSAQTVKIRYNHSTKTLTLSVDSKKLTWGVQTADTSKGSATCSAGASPVNVASGTSVTMTATANFGYQFEGWYNAASGGTRQSTNATYTTTINADTNLYAHFVDATQDTYYLSGRFAIGDSTNTIHSSTVGKNGVEQYGQILNDGQNIAAYAGTGTGTAGSDYGYWTFSDKSTKLPFTLKEGSNNTVGQREYILNTYRTVKQLSEDKDNLLGDYGGSRNDYHNPFLFLVHEKRHQLTVATSAGQNFQSNTSSNKLTMAVNAGALNDNKEIRFNNYASQSNGWVRIHLEENGYDPATGSTAGGSPLIWYEVIDETPAAADTVRISANPTRIDRRSSAATNVTVKGSYVGTPNAPEGSIEYTFYKSTDGVSWTLLRAASTTSSYSYKETAAVDKMYYKVVVSSNTTTGGGKPYDTRSAETSVDVYASGLFMSGAISGTSDPDWGTTLEAYEGYDYPYKRTTSSSYTNSNPYVFALSTITGWDPDYGTDYEIVDANNQFCTIKTEIKEVTIDETPASVLTFKVIPNPNCSNPRIYVDFKNKKIWAIASYTPSAKGTINNYGSEKVTYYFAEADYCKDKSNPTSGTGMRIHYWNNSNPSGLNGTTNVTTAVNVAGKNTSGTAQTNNSIYVSRKDLFGTDFINNNKQRFYVYSVELPIWATSFQFLSSSSTDSFGVQPTYTNSVDDSKNHSITLNPNRIYLLYEWSDKYYVKGVVLDESMWNGSRTTDGNEVSTFKVDTNVIKYKNLNRLNTPYDPNHNLSSAYSAYTTPNALYFGYLENSNGEAKTGQTGCTVDYNSWDASDLFYNLSKTSPKQWAANLAQRKVDPNSYYASVQELVGMTTSKTQFNTNGDGSTFGYLMDTKGNDSTTGKSTANNFPLFAYAGDGTRGSISSYSATNTVAQGKKFPFYQSTLNGITTYSYDSTTDRNRVYSNNNFSIQSTSTNNGFATGKDSDNKQYTGLFPWGGNSDSYGGCAFGLEYDLTFYMTNTGYLTDSSGKDQDIAFNFSGDDDVWVFVDGIKVLDLGGDHKVSAATINFTDGKVYYKSSATSITNSVISSDGALGSWAAGNNNYINVVDLKELMAAYGKPFETTNASTKHTFQMFYMERGAFQSNCVISFNLPQASGLNVRNNVEVNNVNEVLKTDTLYATNPDYFTYQVSSRLVNNDLPAEIRNAAKAPATSVSGLDLTKPVYPYGFETKRVYNDYVNPVLTYILSTSGSPGSGSASLTYGTSGWTNVKDTVYELADDYIQATTAGKAHVTGITENTDEGYFHLLGGEMAVFNDKVPQNAYVRVAQTPNLGTVDTSTTSISYETVTNNKTGSYYITSYSVYDEKSKDYIVAKTPVGANNINSNHYAKDTRLASSTGADGFYFSNYTGDAEDTNSAMRVDFYNEVAVGTIRIEKEMDDLSFSNAKFSFKLKLGRLFGSGSETLKEYPGLEYNLYYSDGTLIGKRWYNSQNGIVLSPGQYAEVTGIPVETYYQVEEIPAAGYSFTRLTKTAEKPNGTTIYYNNTVADANKYEETVLAPAAPKTTDDYIKIEGEGTEDEFYIYKNMIPPVEETVVNATDYVSLNKIEFINQREQFTIKFKYYDRDTTDNVPASISGSVTEYSKTVSNLDKYIYNKDDPLDPRYNYLASLPGINDVETGKFVAYNYEMMIDDLAVEFASDTVGVSNLIDDYRMWSRQCKAEAGMQTITNIKTGKKYTAAESVHHTTSNGQPNATGREWVNYLSPDEKTAFHPEDPASASDPFHAGDLSSYENIKVIEVWLYNTPKQYTVNIYGAASESDLNTATDITLAGSGITITGARVAKKNSSSRYTDVKGYYSQRLSDKKGNDYLDAIAYLSVYDVDSCVKQDGAYVMPETKAPVNIGDLQFAYWAYDSEGKQVASTDYRMGNRITGNFSLYAVYAPARIAGNRYGLTILKDADDTYIDSAGNAKVRINTMFNPYNLVDNDTKIIRAAVVNIYVSKLLREDPTYYTEAKIKELMAQYSAQLKGMLEANSFSPLSLNDISHDPVVNVELTTKGYVKLVNSGSTSIDLTNKNRIEFTTEFGKSQLYTTNGIVGILQLGAMAYDLNGDGTSELNEWVLSDNSILRTYSTS